MQYVAKAKFIRYSPYKLRPLVDIIRGKNVQFALNWLATCSLKKAVPVIKVLSSAAANAKSLANIEASDLMLREFRVDQGPILRSFKPGAMGRANPQRKRLSHMSVRVEPIAKKKEA